MDPITLAAGGALGLAIGTMVGAYLRHEKKFIPPEEQKDIWQHLQETSQKRAELSAKKRTLIEMYNDGKLSENAYITKDAHYTELLGEADDEIDRLVTKLAKVYLDEEEGYSDLKLEQIKNMVDLNKKIKELSVKMEELSAENGQLHMQLNENEEDKKDLLAQKNLMERRAKETSRAVSELNQKQKQAAVKTPNALDDTRVVNLNKENGMLRASLAKNKTTVTKLSSELGVLEAIMERYASVIEQGEQKTSDSLKSLVTVSSEKIKGIVRELGSVENLYKFVRDDVEEVYVPFMFWLNPEDVVKLKAGDIQDKATLLCTLLRAKDEDAKVVVVELKNGMHRSVVVIEDRVLALEPTREFEDFVGAEGEVILKYLFDGSPFKKKIYEFNEKEYQAF